MKLFSIINNNNKKITNQITSVLVDCSENKLIDDFTQMILNFCPFQLYIRNMIIENQFPVYSMHIKEFAWFSFHACLMKSADDPLKQPPYKKPKNKKGNFA